MLGNNGKRSVLNLYYGLVNVCLDVGYRTGDKFFTKVLSGLYRHYRNSCLDACPFQCSAAGGAGAGDARHYRCLRTGLEEDFRAAGADAQRYIL